MNEKSTRRGLLKKCAVTAGGIAAAGIAAELVVPALVKERTVFEDNESFWALHRIPRSPSLDRDVEADVAVIGGGYTGLSAAYHMKKLFPGKSVVLLEARRVGHGGSGRNGGLVGPQPASEHFRVGTDERTHLLTDGLTSESMDELEALVRRHGFGGEIRHRGTLYVAFREEHVKRFREYAETARRLNLPIEFWDRDRLARGIGTAVYFGALYDPRVWEMHPLKLIHALKRAAEDSGVIIFEETPVTAVDEGEVIRLTAGKGANAVKAAALVLAVNGYVSKLGYFANRIITMHTNMAVSRPLPESVFREIGWLSRVPFADSRNYLYHLGSTTDNRIFIAGGSAYYFFNNGTGFEADRRSVEAEFKKELARVYPRLSGVEFEYLWNGILGMSLDFTQSVGVTGKRRNIYYGLSYCAHGVNLSFLFGKIIADLHAGKSGKWEQTPFYNHTLPFVPPEPVKTLGIKGVMAYYRVLDLA